MLWMITKMLKKLELNHPCLQEKYVGEMGEYTDSVY